MTDRITSSPHFTPAKLSQEPGFISIDVRQPAFRIPERVAGLLAFLYSEGNTETVIKILMVDDLEKGYLDNRRFSGRANKVAYCIFPAQGDPALRQKSLGERLKLYARLIEKYNRP